MRAGIKIKKLLSAAVFLAGLFFCFAGCRRNETTCPAPKLNGESVSRYPVFYENIEKIADYVLSCQIPQGGICRNIGEKNNQGGKEAFMTTYCFGGAALIKAFQMTGKKEYLNGAKKFIDFWMAYQNKEPDRFGVAGTFYDKYINEKGRINNHYYNAAESAPNQDGPGYDASDADGPVTAWTIWEYYKITGDRKYLEKYGESYKLILKSIQATVDENDSLTYCHPKYKCKYLMDTCEVWTFLGSLENIFKELSERRISEYCRKWRAKIRQNVNKIWWDGKNGWYFWQRDEEGKFNTEMDWKNWYPDAAEQIWPLLWTVALPRQQQSITVWRMFNKNLPNWHCEDIDWPMAGTVALMMGDYDKAVIQTNNILSKKLSNPLLQTNHCYFIIRNCCAGFNIDGSLHLIADTYNAAGNGFKFKLSSIADGRGCVRIRPQNTIMPAVYMDGRKQTGRFNNGEVIVDMSIKAGGIRSFEIVY